MSHTFRIWVIFSHISWVIRLLFSIVFHFWRRPLLIGQVQSSGIFKSLNLNTSISSVQIYCVYYSSFAFRQNSWKVIIRKMGCTIKWILDYGCWLDGAWSAIANQRARFWLQLESISKWTLNVHNSEITQDIYRFTRRRINMYLPTGSIPVGVSPFSFTTTSDSWRRVENILAI